MCKTLKNVAVAFILGGYPLRTISHSIIISDFLHFTAGNAIFSKSILAPAGSSNYGTQISRKRQEKCMFREKVMLWLRNWSPQAPKPYKNNDPSTSGSLLSPKPYVFHSFSAKAPKVFVFLSFSSFPLKSIEKPQEYVGFP